MRNSVIIILLLLSACKKNNLQTANGPEDIPKMFFLTSQLGTPNSSNSVAQCTALNSDGTLAWKRNDIGNILFDDEIPYYSNGMLFLFTFDLGQQIGTITGHYIYGLDVKTGATRWKNVDPNGQYAVPSFYKDTLYCSYTDLTRNKNYIAAFISATGQLVWSIQLPATEQYVVTQSQDNLLFLKTVHSNNLSVIDMNTRELLWTTKLIGPATYRQFYVSGDQLFLFSTGGVTVVNKKSGLIQWTKSGTFSYGNINPKNSLVYMMDEYETLLSASFSDGKVAWQNAALSSNPNEIYDVLRVQGQNVFFGAQDNTGYYYTSVNGLTGTTNWKKYYDTYGNKIIIGNTIFSLSKSGSAIFKIDGSTGIIIDSIQIPPGDYTKLTILTSSDKLLFPY